MPYQKLLKEEKIKVHQASPFLIVCASNEIRISMTTQALSLRQKADR